MTEQELEEFKEEIECRVIQIVFDEALPRCSQLNNIKVRKALVTALKTAAASFDLTDEEWAERWG